MSGDRWIARYAETLLRWRWAVIVVTVLIVGALGAGMKNLVFATNYRVFFGPGNPELANFEAVQNIYTKNDNIVFIVTPEDGDVFTPHTLAVIEDLTERAWQIPASTRVDSITNFQHSRAEEDDLIVEDLVFGAENLSADEIAEVREIVYDRPEIADRLISSSGAVTGVNVTLQLTGEDPNELAGPVGTSREIAAAIEEAYPHVDVRLSGVVMLNSAFVEAGMGDMQRLIPIMYLVLIGAMILLLRSVSGTFATVLVIGFSSATGLGVAGWLGTRLEPVSAQSATMILTMAIADAIHVLVTMFTEMRGGRDKLSAIRESLRINMVPVFLTSLTTGIGFLSLNFSDSPPLNRLGNITALGVAAAFVFSVSFLPALMSVLPVRVKAREASSGRTVFERFGDWVVARHRQLLWTMVVVIVATVAFLPSNEISDRWVSYFDESIEFRRDSDYMLENLTGLYSLQFSLPAGEPGGIADPEYLAKLDAFTEWFRANPDVVHVSSLSDTIRRLNMNLHGDDPAYYTLPTERDLAAQYLLLYEMSLPYGLDLNNQINVDKSSTRLIATVGDMETQSFLALSDDAEAWLAENAPEMSARATGPSSMFSRITLRNIEAMIWGTAFAFGLISIVLMIALRSWRIGLLSLLPNLIPAAMAFGAWGLVIGKVGFAVSVVAAMTMGIVVDDSVHFLSKYLRARREKGLDAPDAVRYAFATVGRALWVTSMVLVAGFLILAQSTFKQNADMGVLAAVTILFALLADFLLLPGLLIWLDRKREPQEVEQSAPLPAAAEA